MYQEDQIQNVIDNLISGIKDATLLEELFSKINRYDLYTVLHISIKFYQSIDQLEAEFDTTILADVNQYLKDLILRKFTEMENPERGAFLEIVELSEQLYRDPILFYFIQSTRNEIVRIHFCEPNESEIY